MRRYAPGRAAGATTAGRRRHARQLYRFKAFLDVTLVFRQLPIDEGFEQVALILAQPTFY